YPWISIHGIISRIAEVLAKISITPRCKVSVDSFAASGRVRAIFQFLLNSLFSCIPHQKFLEWGCVIKIDGLLLRRICRSADGLVGFVAEPCRSLAFSGPCQCLCRRETCRDYVRQLLRQVVE